MQYHGSTMPCWSYTAGKGEKKLKINAFELSQLLLIVLMFDFSSQILNFFAFSCRVSLKTCRKAMILYSKVTLVFLNMFQTLIRHENDFFVLASIGN